MDRSASLILALRKVSVAGPAGPASAQRPGRSALSAIAKALPVVEGKCYLFYRAMGTWGMSLVQIKQNPVAGNDDELRFTKGMHTVNHLEANDDQDIRVVPFARLNGTYDVKRALMVNLETDGLEPEMPFGAVAFVTSGQRLAVEAEPGGARALGLLHNSQFERVSYALLSAKMTWFKLADGVRPSTISNARPFKI